MNIFAADFLEQKGMFDFEGAGIIIAIKSGTKDTRKKPYKVISSRRKGRCKLYRTIEIRLKRNHEVIGEAVNKTEALNLAKSLIRNFRENVYAKTVYNTKDIDFDSNVVTHYISSGDHQNAFSFVAAPIEEIKIA